MQLYNFVIFLYLCQESQTIKDEDKFIYNQMFINVQQDPDSDIYLINNTLKRAIWTCLFKEKPASRNSHVNY